MTATKVLEQARMWLGIQEGSISHKGIIDIYNAHKPLARGYAVKYTDAWCATFVSAVAIKAGCTDIIPTECSCPKQIELFKKLGCWAESDSRVPTPGDIIFYDWEDSGVGDNTGTSDHVGIVEKVDGLTITVIEGNYSNSVKRRVLAVNGKYIRGYGIPKYKESVSELSADCKLLASKGIINSPDYWAKGKGYSDENVCHLIRAFAKYVKGVDA